MSCAGEGFLGFCERPLPTGKSQERRATGRRSLGRIKLKLNLSCRSNSYSEV